MKTDMETNETNARSLGELSDAELLEKKKKSLPNKIINACIIGFCFGVAVYSAVKNGLGLSTIVPLVLALLAYKYLGKDERMVDEELKARNLK